MLRPPLPVREFKELELMIRSQHPLLALQTLEEERADVLLEYLADSLELPYFSWSNTAGLVRLGNQGAVYGTERISTALDHIKASGLPAIYHLKDCASYFEDATFCRKLRQLHQQFYQHRGAVVFSVASLEVPDELGPLLAHLTLATATDEEYVQFARDLLREVRQRMPVSMQLDTRGVVQLVTHLRGLTLMEVRKVLTQAMVVDGQLGPEDFVRVLQAKREIVERTGVLEYFMVDEDLDSVAGLDKLKRWLMSRSVAFSEPERAKRFGLEPPRGLLLVGVQGCGKSLCAKAVANAWQVPLIRMDPARLYNKYVGETERNLRLAITTAERMAPVVLWIDEIEKGLAAADEASDKGASSRVLGTFLNWLQEKRATVFVVATSNDIQKLPPELLRKGRFDEIFFVDLPDAGCREQILSLHLRKRARHPSHFDLQLLADSSEGFSGAELEQAVVAALYSAFEEQSELGTAHVLAALESTLPLSQTMAQPIARLRAWAKGRTIPAH